jgi:hypothetical protein
MMEHLWLRLKRFAQNNLKLLRRFEMVTCLQLARCGRQALLTADCCLLTAAQGQDVYYNSEESYAPWQ